MEFPFTITSIRDLRSYFWKLAKTRPGVGLFIFFAADVDKRLLKLNDIDLDTCRRVLKWRSWDQKIPTSEYREIDIRWET